MLVCEVPDEFGLQAFLSTTLRDAFTAIGYDNWSFPDGLGNAGGPIDVPIIVQRSLVWDRRFRLKTVTGGGAVYVYPRSAGTFKQV